MLFLGLITPRDSLVAVRVAVRVTVRVDGLVVLAAWGAMVVARFSPGRVFLTLLPAVVVAPPETALLTGRVRLRVVVCIPLLVGVPALGLATLVALREAIVVARLSPGLLFCGFAPVSLGWLDWRGRLAWVGPSDVTLSLSEEAGGRLRTPFGPDAIVLERFKTLRVPGRPFCTPALTFTATGITQRRPAACQAVVA